MGKDYTQQKGGVTSLDQSPDHLRGFREAPLWVSRERFRKAMSYDIGSSQ